MHKNRKWTLEEKEKKYNQEHIISFYNELKNNEKKYLLNQINCFDFVLINELKKLVYKKKENYEISSMSSSPSNDKYYYVGMNSIKKGEYALVTMAGGQGSRLGFDGPKGTYILEYGINKSLFRIQCDKLKNIYKMTNVYVPWYIMTSHTNNKATVKFFEDNNLFNYPKEKIKFFIQDELPMIDIKGKIIMGSKSSIKMGANGSGGVFLALSKSGILDEMKKTNIKWILIGGIDNPLLPIDNPDLIGFAIKIII